MTEEEMILTHLLGCRRIDLYTKKQDLTPTQQEQFQKILELRRNGEPLQYLLGETDFMGFRLSVDPRVLIPRPETELLVLAAFEYLAQWNQPLRILDIGTGSGNIAIALAKLLENTAIVALDFSQGALDLARLNAKMNAVESQIQFLESDLFNNLTNNDTFDVIISNPPYIPSGNIPDLPCDVRFEPPLALDGGADGLQFYRRIFAGIPQYLNKGGLLFLEFGDGQALAVQMILSELQFKILEVRKDLAGRERILVAEKL